ncbi:MAG: flagellar hook-basal body complex protein FliE [Bdellovibrionales bacterium]
MDGLTISNSENLIQQGQTLRESRESGIKREVTGPLEAGQKSFGDTLKEAVQSVNQMQQTADRKMEDLATGKAKSIPDVMIAAEKADIALKLMVQVRNKVIEAYQEIMKMQV